MGFHQVFIDKHYQARALDDMVIAVQSDEVEWESHLSCNGKAIVWNLRNPLRSMLSATAHHLSGVLPMHLAYDDAHGKVSQDWLWSVGCSPLSHTASRLANFSVYYVPAFLSSPRPSPTCPARSPRRTLVPCPLSSDFRLL